MFRASCYSSAAKPSVELSGPSVEPTENGTETHSNGTETHSERVVEVPRRGTFLNAGPRERSQFNPRVVQNRSHDWAMAGTTEALCVNYFKSKRPFSYLADSPIFAIRGAVS
jgi:hypothetical protein